MSPGPLATQGSNQQQNSNQQRPGEPQLMPVPSPQQIQYLNQFDDQELTIKRQRNLSARDADLISPELDFLPDFSSNNGNQMCNPMNPNTNGPMNGSMPSSAIQQQMQTHANMQNQLQQQQQQPPQSAARFASPMTMDMHCGSPMMSGPPGAPQRFPPPGQSHYPDGRMNPIFPPAGVPPGMYAPPLSGRPASAGQPQMQSFGQNGPSNGSNARPPPPPPNPMLHNSMMSNESNSSISMPLQPPLGELPMTSNHLQNLQKMNPPFDIGQPSKMNESFSAGQHMPPQMQHPTPVGSQMTGPGQMGSGFEMHPSNVNGPTNNNPQMMHHPEMQMQNCGPINCRTMNCATTMMQPPMSQPAGHPYPNSLSPMSSCGQSSNGYSCPPNINSQNASMMPPSPAGNQQPPMMPNGGRSPGLMYNPNNSSNSVFPHSASPKLNCSPSPQQMIMNSNRNMLPNRTPCIPPPTLPTNPNAPLPNQMMHAQAQRPGQFQSPHIQMNTAKPNTIQYR